MKQHSKKIIVGILVVLVLAFVFWYGGDAPGLRGWTPTPKATPAVVQTEKPVSEEPTQEEQSDNKLPATEEKSSVNEKNKPQKQDGTPMTPAEKIAMAAQIAESKQMPAESKPAIQPTPAPVAEETIPSEPMAPVVEETEIQEAQLPTAEAMVVNEDTGKDQYLTDPVPEGKPLPVEPQNVEKKDNELTCTLSVRCDTILKNIDWLDSEKVSIVPEDGVIFAEKTVTFSEGESVFDLLLREMQQNKIHMEFEHTPLYNSAYIEGIANLYEFDCGELSGWMYKVNDWFPNYGCSRYQLKAGDKVEWVYTCDLGVDVGGFYATNGN